MIVYIGLFEYYVDKHNYAMGDTSMKLHRIMHISQKRFKRLRKKGWEDCALNAFLKGLFQTFLSFLNFLIFPKGTIKREIKTDLLLKLKPPQVKYR